MGFVEVVLAAGEDEVIGEERLAFVVEGELVLLPEVVALHRVEDVDERGLSEGVDPLGVSGRSRSIPLRVNAG